MAQKKKSTKPQASAPSAEEIASRLSDAQERMGTVAQQAEQRSEQTRAQLREREESAQARMSESERQRSEAAQAAKSVAERKLAQLSYAESYRERMQSERAKARKQKEAEEARARAEAEARAKEERQARIEEALQREQEELNARNARAEEMLRAAREKSAPQPQAEPAAAAPAPEKAPEAPVEEPKEAPKAPRSSALDKYKESEEQASEQASEPTDEPLSFDLSDLGLDDDMVDNGEDEDIMVVDENGNPMGNDGFDAYPPMMPPDRPPQQPDNGMRQLIGEMRAERAEANARQAEADARQAEAQRRSIEMMIEQENTRAEREERFHRENAEREERLARESRDSLSDAMADVARRGEAAARGDGDARELAYAREVAGAPAYSEPEQTAQQSAQEDAPVTTGEGVPPMITIGGVTYEEDAEHQKRISKAEKEMQKRLRKQAKKEALAFIKEKKAENKGLRREIKEVRRLAKEDERRQPECITEELNIRLQIIENMRAMIDYAKEFKKNGVARDIRRALKEEVQGYGRCYKRAEKCGGIKAYPIPKDYVMSAWDREKVPALPRAEVSDEIPVRVTVESANMPKCIKKQAGVVDGALVALEGAVKAYTKSFDKLQKAKAKGKGVEKAAGALTDADAELSIAKEDVDYALADLASVYEEAIASEEALSKKAKLEKQRDKALVTYGEKKEKILSKLPTSPDGGTTPIGEDSANFRNDTDGAAENAEGVRIVPVALPTTRDNVTDNTEQAQQPSEEQQPSEAQPLSAGEALTRVNEEQQSEESVITTVRPAPATATEEPKQQSEQEAPEEPAEPKPTRDELALRQFDAYNEAQVARAAGRADKIDRKTAAKQLTELQKQAQAQRTALTTAKEATKIAKKKKAELTAPVVDELNARAALLETVSRILILSHALGEEKLEKTALSEMSAQARAYNTTVLYLPKQHLEGVARLDEQIANGTLTSGTPVSISRVRHEEVEEAPFVILPSATARDASAAAVATAAIANATNAEERVITTVRPAPVTAPVIEEAAPVAQEPAVEEPTEPKPTRDELALRQFDAYNEAQVARAAGRADKIDRKTAAKQLTELQKQAQAQRTALTTAKEATKIAKKKKAELTAPVVDELNARAALLETVSRILILSHALGEEKLEKNAITEMSAEARAYNTSVLALPAEYREGVAHLDEQLANAILTSGAPVSIDRMRYEEVEEAPFVLVPSVNERAASSVALATAAVATAPVTAERVITVTRPLVVAPAAPVEEVAAPVVEAPMVEEPAAPKPTRDEIALAQYDAYNDSLLVRSLAKADKTERKNAKKTLDSLMKQAEAQRRSVSAASAEVSSLKKKKESTTVAVAKELSERAALIETVATVMLLSSALGLDSTKATAQKQMRAEIKAYNAATRALSKAERGAVGEIPESLVNETLNSGTVPSIARIRVEEPVVEEEFVMLPSVREREESAVVAAVALATAAAPVHSEIVLNASAPAPSVAPTPVVTEAPVAEEIAEATPEAPKPTRDELALASYDAYNETQYRKAADRLTKSNRKSATTQLSALQKSSEQKRREVASLSQATTRAKKNKENTGECCALELNARAAYITELSKIAILAGALGQTKAQKSATDAITKQVSEYNSTLRLLPKAQRSAVSELPRNMAKTVVNTGTLPTLPAFRVEEGEQPIEMITYESAPDALAVALAAAGAVAQPSEISISAAAPAPLRMAQSAPVAAPVEQPKAASAEPETPKVSRRAAADERAYTTYTAYNEEQFTRTQDRNARTDRKSANAQISALEKQTVSLRREVQSASTSLRQAKKQKASLNAPLARELNARADLVMALSKILLLANALGDQKKVKKTTSALRTEAQAYNTALRSLPKEQRRNAVPMDKNPDIAILNDGTLPALVHMHVEEPEAEIAILPSPTESVAVRQAMASAAADVTPEEFYIPSHTTVAAAPARLSRKEANKQMQALESQNTEMRRRLANAEASRISARKAKQSTTAADVASLNARAAIIEINARMLALAKSQGLKKAEANATRTIDAQVRSYNADARALSKSERIKVAPISDKLSQSIAQGVPMSAIPRIRLDAVNVDLAEFTPAPVVQGGGEDIVITRNSDGTVYPILRSQGETTSIASERPERLYTTTTQPYDNKQITEYLQKQKKSVSALKKERQKEERRTASLSGNERIASILRVRNATAKIIAVEIDTIEILRTESAFRSEMSGYKSALSEEVRRYNKAGDAYRRLTGKKLAPLAGNLADRVARGMEYEPPRIAEFSEESVSIPAVALIPTSEFGLATEPVYENLNGRARAVSRAERRARTEEYMRVEAQSRQAREASAYEGVEALAATRTTVTRDYLEIEAMDRREYRQYVKASEKRIAELRKQLSAYEKQNKKATETDTHAALVGAIVALEREICEDYFAVLKTGVATGAHDTKKFSRLAKTEIQSYNRRLKELSRYTGNKYPQADASIPEKIVKRKAYTPMPAVSCEIDPTAQLRRESELRRLQGERDARQKRVDSALLTKQKRKSEKKAKQAEKTTDKAPLSKNEIKKYEEVDLALVSARYEEELRTLEREVVELERQYTLEPAKTKREIAKRKNWIRQTEQEKKEALRAEKQDNARYFALLSVPPSKLVSKKMPLEDAIAYQEDLMQLMRERIALNERILSLYRGVEGGSDTTALRVEKMYLAAHNSALKRYNGLTKRVRKLHITVAQKEQLFALINQCAKEEATVKVEKKKISMFKLQGAARKAQKLEIRKAETALRRTKVEIERKMRARTAADRRHTPAEQRFVWAFLLLALVIVVFMVWVFRVPLWELLKTLIDQFSQGNVGG